MDKCFQCGKEILHGQQYYRGEEIYVHKDCMIEFTKENGSEEQYIAMKKFMSVGSN